MNLHLARHLAITLMKSHGVGDWSFSFDHARRRFGSCHWGKKRLTLSRPLTLLNDDLQVRDTILHEIAHALTSPRAGHGPAWKAACLRVGANPKRCYDDRTVISPPRRVAPLQIGCPTCGWWHDRFRQPAPRRKLVCKKCRTVVIFRSRPAAAIALPTN